LKFLKKKKKSSKLLAFSGQSFKMQAQAENRPKRQAPEAWRKLFFFKL
jgi:hypothetical protein